MGDTFIRVLAMLREVPAAPRAIDTVSLQTRLADVGFDVDLRTIQRDLVRFSTVLALTCDDTSRPYRWSFGTRRAAEGIPTVDPARALALELLDRHLGALLPPSIRAQLRDDLGAARALLGAGAPVAGAVSSWPEKIAAVTRGPRVVAPELAPGVLDAVADALFRDRQVSLRYQGRDAARARTWEVSPLGLVSRGPVLVLVACFSDTLSPRQFVLHRATDARVLEVPAERPPGFTLANYVSSGELAYRIGKTPVSLRARFESLAVREVLETPLSEDQTVTSAGGGAVLVSATVEDTHELRAWLLGLGACVEVLEPAHLREHIAAELSRAAARYRSDG